MKRRHFWIIALSVIITFALINCGDNEKTATYSVTFDSNGGSTVAQIKNVTSGSTIIEPVKPTKDDNSFEGWYKEEVLTNEWNFSIDTVTTDITLYAKWQQNGHTGIITAFGKTINVKGDASISDTDFATAKAKLQDAMTRSDTTYAEDGAGAAYRPKFIVMLDRHGFVIIIETGDAIPAANAQKSMTMGVDYLLTTAENVVSSNINGKVLIDAFANE